MAKSKLVPIAGVGGVNDLATILCCKVGSLPMTFVGFPVTLGLEKSGTSL